MEFRPLPNKYFLLNVNGILKWRQFPGYFPVDGDFVTIAKYPPPAIALWNSLLYGCRLRRFSG